MGCCTRFRTTWIPGYSSDVIDPNKAFDFERRLVIFKKVVVSVLLLALLTSLIYFLVSLTSSGGKTDSADSGGISKVSSLTANAANGNTLTTAAVIPLKISTSTDNITSDPKLVVTPVTNQNNTNSSVVDLPLPTSNDNNNLELASVPLTNGDNSDDDVSVITSLMNNTQNGNTGDQNHSANSSCSSNGNVLECVALSKEFKTVMTFSNSTRHNGSVEGYIMVKMQNSIWHPYCSPQWTLEMGYRLCKGLGFQNLQKLQTIEIYELKLRMAHKLGKNVSLHSGNPTLPQELLILTTERSVRRLKANTSQFNCQVGYISCF